MHVVRASGQAIVSMKPDRVEIQFGVVTQGPAAEAAASQNAAQTSQMLRAIRQALGNGGKISTSDYSISPSYQNQKNGAPRKIVGYTANNTVDVTMDDLNLIGKVMDAAATAGANEVNRISFTLRDDQAARAQALAKAATEARDNAEAIAKALNLHVAGIVNAETADVEDLRPVHGYGTMPGVAQRIEIGTPIEAGDIDVTATVVVTLAVE